MSDTRKKSTKNIIFGLLGQIITIVFGLCIPRLIILSYGSETNGLVTSVTQIFAYVALLEAGVGGATIQALYKPVAGNDKKEISAILAATHSYYKRTGILYVIAVVCISILYPLVVKSDIGFWTVFGVIMFNGMGGAINFFFQGKYHLLLQAEGKNYIKTNLTTIVHTASSILKIVLLLMGAGVVVLQAAYFLLNIAQMLYIVIYIKRHYGWLNLFEKPNFGAISQKNSVMVHQISALIFGNTDSLILTFFSGLKVVSVYTLISSLIGYVNNIITNFSSGILFSLGQSFQSDKKRFNELYNMFEVFYYALMTFCLSMIFIFLNPFLALYTEGVTDIIYVDKYLPVLFVINYWLTWARVPAVYVVNNCAGHFKLTQKQTIIESSINIIVSLICVIKWGIYGVLFGTIVALLYRTNEMIFYSAKKILMRSIWVTYKRLLFNTVWMFVSGILGKLLLPEISNYFQLFSWAILYAVVIFAGVIFVNFIFEKQTLKDILGLFRKKVKV